MKQTMISQKETPLLTYASSKLNPEVFSHPVWMRFSHKDKTVTPETIQNLLRAAEDLKCDRPGDACQVLLACAVFQNQAGRCHDALRITQQALALAERNCLHREMTWATWGACAICFKQENYEQAAQYLEYLQAGLSDQNEWILADFVEMVKLSLLTPGSVGSGDLAGWPHNRPRDHLLSDTFDWLHRWGASTESGFKRSPDRPGKFPFFRSIWRMIRTSLSGWRLPHRKAEVLLRASPTSMSFPTAEETQTCVSSDEFRRASNLDNVPTSITTVVQMLGSFRITIQGTPVKLPASRGLSLLKYLLLHHRQDTPREVLMDIFWPDSDPEAARNNLNVAMHNLRQALRGATDMAIIRFEDGAYGLATNLDIWLDVEEFENCIKEGLRLEARDQRTAAEAKYEIALNLYQGIFLADSPYESWTMLDRERLEITYLETLKRLSEIYFNQERYGACVTLCQRILNCDSCREDAHCRIMQCYSRLGQGPLALRQYQVCVEALRVELEVDPSPETTRLYNRIRNHEHV
jgi:DNA-binding SARP family transcriptional activator